MSDQLPTRHWFSFRQRTLFVALICVGVALVVLPPVANFMTWVRHKEAGAQLIASLETRRPTSASPDEWEVANFWMGVAYANICYSPDQVELSELKRLNDDLSTKLHGNVDLNTVSWIWHRLAETGPSGAQYVAKFEPRYRQELVEARNRAATSQANQP